MLDISNSQNQRAIALVARVKRLTLGRDPDLAALHATLADDLGHGGFIVVSCRKPAVRNQRRETTGRTTTKQRTLGSVDMTEACCQDPLARLDGLLLRSTGAISPPNDGELGAV